MWIFAGDIRYVCDVCDQEDIVDVKDFDIDFVSSSERGMGSENIYVLLSEFDCNECSNSISLNFEMMEYPVGFLNFSQNDSTGAQTFDEPYIEYLEEFYSISEEDFLSANASIKSLITRLQEKPELVRKISFRKFEEVVCEIFRAQGFQVELTPPTADGGKDIIAIQENSLGIPVKYFIECKRYAENNTVGVGIVRTLHGVKGSKDGPNKTILVTTSSFTLKARKFVEEEITSKWDMDLVDFVQLTKWIKDYK